MLHEDNGVMGRSRAENALTLFPARMPQPAADPLLLFSSNQPKKQTKNPGLNEQQSVVESVLACDREQQAQLFNSVVLAGGGCCFEGLAERLKAEIEASLDAPSTGWRVKVLAAGSGERK